MTARIRKGAIVYSTTGITELDTESDWASTSLDLIEGGLLKADWSTLPSDLFDSAQTKLTAGTRDCGLTLLVYYESIAQSDPDASNTIWGDWTTVLAQNAADTPSGCWFIHDTSDNKIERGGLYPNQWLMNPNKDIGTAGGWTNYLGNTMVGYLGDNDWLGGFFGDDGIASLEDNSYTFVTAYANFEPTEYTDANYTAYRQTQATDIRGTLDSNGYTDKLLMMNSLAAVDAESTTLAVNAGAALFEHFIHSRLLGVASDGTTYNTPTKVLAAINDLYTVTTAGGTVMVAPGCQTTGQTTHPTEAKAWCAFVYGCLAFGAYDDITKCYMSWSRGNSFFLSHDNDYWTFWDDLSEIAEDNGYPALGYLGNPLTSADGGDNCTEVATTTDVYYRAFDNYYVVLNTNNLSDSQTFDFQGDSYTLGGKRALFVSRYSSNVYVSTEGSDDNDGSLASPWATVQQAVDWVRHSGAAGCHIHIKSGSYLEQIDISGLHGTSDNWITISPYNGQDVLISSSLLVDKTPHYDNWHGIVKIFGETEYLHISGITFAWGGCDYGFIVMGDTNTERVQHLLIDYCTIHSVSGSGIHCNGGVNPPGSTTSCYPECYTRDIEFSHNTVYNVNDGITHSDESVSPNESISMSNIIYPYVHDNLVYNFGKEGIDLKSGTRSGCVYNNTIYPNRESPKFNYEYDHVAIYCDGMTRMNERILIFNNYISGNSGSGIIIGAEEVDGGTDLVDVFNNVIILPQQLGHTACNGIQFSTDTTSAYVTNANVYSNSVFVGNGSPLKITPTTTYLTNNKVYNNIFAGMAYNCPWVSAMDAADSGGRVDFHNNSFWRCNGAFRATWNGTEYQYALNPEKFGEGALVEDPDYTDSGSSLVLLSTSPCISSANMTLISSNDYLGHPRGAQGDIGAYEYAWEEQEEPPVLPEFNSNFFMGQGNLKFLNPSVSILRFYRI